MLLLVILIQTMSDGLLTVMEELKVNKVIISKQGETCENYIRFESLKEAIESDVQKNTPCKLWTCTECLVAIGFSYGYGFKYLLICSSSSMVRAKM